MTNESTSSEITLKLELASNRQTPVESGGGVSHVGPGGFIAGWGQARQMLRSLTNSLQALRSAQRGQQRAEGLQEEETRVFSHCQLIPHFYFSGILLSCPQCSTCLHRVLVRIYHLNDIGSFTGQNYSSQQLLCCGYLGGSC